MPMVAVTYDYYSNRFFGKLPEEDFKRLSVKATALVRQITGGKADGVTDDDFIRSNAVRNAICEVCDVYATAEAGEIESESNDNVSVKYSRSGISGTVTSPLSAASLHLAGTGLLYMGVYECTSQTSN